LDNYNFKEIRVPVFEHTELFQRGVGETTDVVQKEMYTFEDKGGRSITLRPEGTAGVVRSYIENGMSSQATPIKLWYEMPMYRYENVQKGRLREFRQFGTEVLGTSSYLADVEVITLGNKIFEALNIPNIKLNINSIGCSECRKKYQEALRDFIRPNLDTYCDTCKTRFEKNPMRILDCKERKCKELNQGAPIILDYLCEECKTHFENVKKLLTNLEISFKIDSSIVRGLDYYNHTVFEVEADIEGFGAQNVIGAGGRYNGMIEQLGGPSTPAIGFAVGFDRLMLALEYEKVNIPVNTSVDLFLLYVNDDEKKYAAYLTNELRMNGFVVETDYLNRSLKAGFKQADRLNSKFTIVLNSEMLENNEVKIKNNKTREEEIVSLDALIYYLDENYVEYLRKFDDRVYFNKKTSRPYIGVVYQVLNLNI